jgi:hypothetical protein
MLIFINMLIFLVLGLTNVACGFANLSSDNVLFANVSNALEGESYRFTLALLLLTIYFIDPYDRDIWEHHGYALAEVWIGRPAVNAGPLTGVEFLDAMTDAIKKHCHSRPHYCWTGASPYWLPTKHIINPYDGKHPDVRDGKFQSHETTLTESYL